VGIMPTSVNGIAAPTATPPPSHAHCEVRLAASAPETTQRAAEEACQGAARR
jgi:hypothetical protein